MMTYITNYLDLFDYTFKDARITFPFDFFSKDEIYKAAQENGLSDKQRDSLLFSLKIVKDQLSIDANMLNYFMVISPTLIKSLDNLFKIRLKEKQAAAAEDLAIELRGCIMAQVAPIVNAAWNSNTPFKEQMIKSFLPSYMSYIASLWRELLEYQEWEEEQEKNLSILLLNVLEHHNDPYDAGLMQKIKTELLTTAATINYATESPGIARANGKKVVHDLSDSYNSKSAEEMISALKQRINRAGISSQSVPVILSLVGYYLGINKHKYKVTMTQYYDEEGPQEGISKAAEPADEAVEEKTEEKKSSFFSSLFTKKSHKQEKHEPTSEKKIKI